MAELMFPDIAGSFMRGQQFGTQQRQTREQEQRRSGLASLAQQAYTADPSQREGLIGQAIGIDPAAGMALGEGLQGNDDRRTKSMVNMAKMLTSAPEQYRAGLYQQMMPALQQMGLTQLPPQYDETVAQAAQSIVQAYAPHGEGTPSSIRELQMLQANPELAALDMKRRTAGFDRPQLIQTQDGYAWATPQGAAPLNYGGGAPTQTGAHPSQEAVLAKANEMAAQGVPTEQIDAFVQQSLSQPATTGGQRVMPAQKPTAQSELERRLALADQMGASEEEKRRMVVGGSSARDAQRISTADMTKARQKMTQIASARQQLEAVKQNFQKLKGSFSAGIGGQYLPTPEGQAFDRAIANLAPLVTAVTRVPGIGAMSDYESKLQNASLPSRGTYEDVTEQQIADLERLFDTIESGYGNLVSGDQMRQPAPTDAPANDIDSLLDLYR